MVFPFRPKKWFEKLYLVHRGWMYAVALGLLENEADAEDAVQQVFLATWEEFSEFEEIDGLRTHAFLAEAVEREAVEILRRRMMERNVPLDPGLTLASQGDCGLREAIARLPLSYRRGLFLRYGKGLSSEEMAAVLKITDSGARKLVGRARTALAAELEKEKKRST